MKVKVAIAGGAGYTGGELLRLLLQHPQVDLVSVLSTTKGGEPLWKAHPDLLGNTDKTFDTQLPASGADVLFLCLGHGASRAFLDAHTISSFAHIIDLSQDFRARNNQVYGGRTFLYALPEAYPHPNAYASALQEAGNAANPGCFATAIQLALLPLAQGGWLTSDIHVHAITGATGAGAKLSETSHFPYRNNNISVYKPFEHQHLLEIRETLAALSHVPTEALPPVYFIPVRGDFSRGIFASVYTPCALSQEEAEALFTAYYAPHPFVHVAPFGISLKEVVHTQKAFIHVEKHGGMLLITSALDNLLKGASGTAVQNMNTLMGLDPTLGLPTASIAY